MKRNNLIAAAVVACLPLVVEADVTTVFTLGKPYVNYIPALTQDAAPTSGIWSLDYLYDCGLNTCAGGAQSNIYLTLPSDPVNPSARLNIGCTGVLTLDTRPAYGAKTQQPDGVLESTETCPFDESWYSGTWSGTVTYNYTSVKQTHCSSGRGAHCITAYYPVVVGGYGSLTTADPPPPPPPPPPPIVSTINTGAVANGTVTVVSFVGPVVIAQFDLVNYLVTLTNVDGTTPTATLDFYSVYPVGDDGETTSYSIFGTIYNPDGSVFGTYDCELTVDVNGNVLSGALTESPQ